MDCVFKLVHHDVLICGENVSVGCINVVDVIDVFSFNLLLLLIILDVLHVDILSTSLGSRTGGIVSLDPPVLHILFLGFLLLELLYPLAAGYVSGDQKLLICRE